MHRRNRGKTKATRDNPRKFELFRSVFEHSKSGMVLADLLDGAFVVANPAFLELTGYPLAHVVKLSVRDLHPPEFVGLAEETFRKMVEGEAATIEALPVVRRDGSIIYADISGSAFTLNGMNYILGEFHDVTEMRNAKVALNRAQKAAKIGSWSMQMPSGETEWSDQTYEIFGISPGSAVSFKTFLEFVHPDDREFIQTVEKRLTPTDHCRDFNFRILVEGRTKWIRSIVDSEFDSEGNLKRLFGVDQDISAIKESELALEKSKIAAETASLSKTKFLAAASHDLRQPLAATALVLAALQGSELNADQREMLDILKKANESQKEMLNSLLDIARLDCGSVVPQFRDLPVDALFVWVEDAFWMQFKDKGLRFDIYYPSEKLVLHSDHALLKSILRNLISNALKYCEAGGALVSLRRRGHSALIQVWDTGIGISSQNLEYVFDEFYQVSNPDRDSAKGLGLGLSIVKRLATLIGARLYCRSREGYGSVFAIEVPLANPFAAKSTTPACQMQEKSFRQIAQFFSKKHVVIIEDDANVRRAMEIAFSSVGLRASTFDCAESLLESPIALEADYYISDFRLSGSMNGFELLEEIEQRKKASINAVIITGETVVDELSELQLKQWKTVIKPCDATDLLAALVE